VITGGAAVKISAAPALGFLGVMVARRWGARPRHLVFAAVLLGAVFGVITVLLSVGTGLGFGWIDALGTNGLVKSWMSPMTGLGYLAGGLGIAFGLGNHTDSTIDIMRTIGELVSVVIIGKLLWDTWKGRLQPMIGLGLCLGAVVVLGATVQAWYLLWAAIPLAAGTGASAFRTIATVISAGVAMIVPPTGSTFDGHTYILPDSYVAAAIVLAIAVFVVRKTVPLLPWRDPAGDRPPARPAAVTGSDPGVA
jgi:alpha-1,6-mannosyltransferase